MVTLTREEEGTAEAGEAFSVWRDSEADESGDSTSASSPGAGAGLRWQRR